MNCLSLKDISESVNAVMKIALVIACLAVAYTFLFKSKR